MEINKTLIKYEIKKNYIIFTIGATLFLLAFYINLNGFLFQYINHYKIENTKLLEKINETYYKSIISNFYKFNPSLFYQVFIIVFFSITFHKFFYKGTFEYLYSMPISRKSIFYSSLFIIFIINLTGFIILIFFILFKEISFFNSVLIFINNAEKQSISIINLLLNYKNIINFFKIILIALNFTLTSIFFSILGFFISILFKNSGIKIFISILIWIIFFILFNFFNPETTIICKISPFFYNYHILDNLKINNYIKILYDYSIQFFYIFILLFFTLLFINKKDFKLD